MAKKRRRTLGTVVQSSGRYLARNCYEGVFHDAPEDVPHGIVDGFIAGIFAGSLGWLTKLSALLTSSQYAR